jgi:hypothetical protein
MKGSVDRPVEHDDYGCDNPGSAVCSGKPDRDRRSYPGIPDMDSRQRRDELQRLPGHGFRCLKLGGGCFAAGTPVQMTDGSPEPVENVEVVDLLARRDPNTD